jgi:hypothetical protein
MKLDTCNKLADHIIERANYHRQIARTYADMYADTDNKEYQNTFKKACEIEKELRDLHATACLFLHKIEEELNVK